MAADPYASHLPVLRALGRLLAGRVSGVLEFGAGRYSTLTFTDPAVYPSAVEVASVEDDGDWLMQVQTLVVKEEQDVCWRPIYARSMTNLIKQPDLDHYSLIFIDNGRSAAERVPVIEAVAALRPSALVVIHDFEVPEYQQVAAGFDHCLIDTSSKPHTAVLWNGDRPEMEGFIENLYAA